MWHKSCTTNNENTKLCRLFTLSGTNNDYSSHALSPCEGCTCTVWRTSDTTNNEDSKACRLLTVSGTSNDHTSHVLIPCEGCTCTVSRTTNTTNNKNSQSCRLFIVSGTNNESSCHALIHCERCRCTVWHTRSWTRSGCRCEPLTWTSPRSFPGSAPCWPLHWPRSPRPSLTCEDCCWETPLPMRYGRGEEVQE